MKVFIITLSLIFSSTTLLASEDGHRHHDAHEHGVGQLNLAIENNDIFIELQSPAANIVGFEHQAKNKQQQQTIKQAMQTLRDGNRLFAFIGSNCRMTEAEVNSGLADTNDHHGHKDQLDEGNSHAEFDASYQFSCDNAAALTSIEVKLLDLFNNTEELQVQIITPSGQRADELNHKNFILNL